MSIYCRTYAQIKLLQIPFYQLRGSNAIRTDRGPYHRIATYYAMITTIQNYDMHYNPTAYTTDCYHKMVHSGKTNLRKLHTWTMTKAYLLHAALLLREVTTIMHQPKTKLSDAIAPKLFVALHNTDIKSSFDAASSSHTLHGDQQSTLVSDHISCDTPRTAS